ncbi:hypothetical protein NJC38_02955 [Pseudomonas sp. 21LCFQ010]|uniref:hypothetical protein n=1 Tax=Pseudomonas sp. 21LCFQ010 TaxID=2957506 RepID=UPI002096E5A0|nr:hypothetical protein [Pseudomonas sp. 21LCFQ010]MCO8161110.1 hypothetical protein [Pseudomonas sp. 21LCFQ010]
MHLEIDYGDGDVDVIDMSKRDIAHLIPAKHRERVAQVSSLIQEVLQRREFFESANGVSDTEILTPDSPHHKQLRRHIQDLRDIPYDGYHTDYSLWASRFHHQSADGAITDRSEIGRRPSQLSFLPSGLSGLLDESKDPHGSQSEQLMLTFEQPPKGASASSGHRSDKPTDRTERDPDEPFNS